MNQRNIEEEVGIDQELADWLNNIKYGDPGYEVAKSIKSLLYIQSRGHDPGRLTLLKVAVQDAKNRIRLNKLTL